jgi:hypothetical protein
VTLEERHRQIVPGKKPKLESATLVTLSASTRAVISPSSVTLLRHTQAFVLSGREAKNLTEAMR